MRAAMSTFFDGLKYLFKIVFIYWFFSLLGTFLTLYFGYVLITEMIAAI